MAAWAVLFPECGLGVGFPAPERWLLAFWPGGSCPTGESWKQSSWFHLAPQCSPPRVSALPPLSPPAPLWAGRFLAVQACPQSWQRPPPLPPAPGFPLVP